MMKAVKILNTLQDISDAVARVDEQLQACKTKTEDRIKAVLTMEEVLVKMHDQCSEQERPIYIGLDRRLHGTKIRISMAGNELAMEDDTLLDNADLLADEYGPDAENLIRNMVLRVNADRMRSRYAKGVNTIEIWVTKNDKALLYETLIGLAMGVLLGLITRLFCSTEVANWLCNMVYMPIYSLFLTAIAMIMVPMVFFSLSSSVAGFGDLSSLGRTGSKVFGMYLMTTLLAILSCVGLNALFQPGRPGLIDLPTPTMGVETETIHLSLMDKLLSIVPSNFAGAFASADMMQIMFLAVLIGIAACQIGQYTQTIKNALDSLNALFSRATAIISRFLPYAIFGAIAQMVVTMDVRSIGVLASWVGVLVLCLFAQLVIYLILMAVVGHFNPFTFLRKYYQAPLTAFFTCSSNATMPVTMECCRKAGVSPKVYSFSIPLGANINMDGASITFMFTTLFMVGLYGLTIDLSTLLSLVMTVMLISVALPGVPGAGTACLLMCFAIVGVPAEAFGLVIGLLPLTELPETAVNVTGDGVVTAIVAKSEGEMDMDMFNS